MEIEHIKEKIMEWRNSPIALIRDWWGLVPQPLICVEEHEHRFKCFGEFEKGKHITWQQWLILVAVEKAIRGEAPKRISVASGHGTGKSSLLSMLMHWFLFTRKDAQVGATSPSANQLFDVLWKEVEVWHKKLPKELYDVFDWQSSYFRVKESPETWFARARTGRKENPEAFAGLHGTHVMLIADEGSAVPDEIYRVAEGSLTNKDTLVILISNPTRLEGYFYDTHKNVKEKESWQCLGFSSIESPIVEPEFVDRIKAKYGEDSNEYGFMVLGKFPSAEGMIDGWLPMFGEEDIKQQVQDIGPFMKPAYMGVDPSGLGKNKSVWVVRDAFKMKVAALETKSATVSLAEKTVTIAGHYEIPPENVKLDNFGVGANVSQEIALGVHERIHAINVGGKPRDERFLNIRAEMYWLLREWLKKGGKLVKHPEWRQLLVIYYKRTLSGKIQVMSKEEMMKKGWDSPDVADAGALTFVGAGLGNEGAYQSVVMRAKEMENEEIHRLTNLY